MTDRPKNPYREARDALANDYPASGAAELHTAPTFVQELPAVLSASNDPKLRDCFGRLAFDGAASDLELLRYIFRQTIRIACGLQEASLRALSERERLLRRYDERLDVALARYRQARNKVEDE